MLRVSEFRAVVCMCESTYVDYSKLFIKEKWVLKNSIRTGVCAGTEKEMRYAISDGIM